MKPGNYFFLVSLLLSLPFVGFCEAKIKIGVSLPLSGGSASEGVDLRSLLIFGNKHVAHDAYELVFEDDQCSDRQAVSIAHKFIDIDHVKYVLGYACSGAVLAAAPLYEKSKILTIALATGAPEISQAGDYIFRTIPSLNVAAEHLFKNAAARFKKVGILSEETAYCQGLAKAFVSQSTAGAFRIYSENYLPETNDFRTLFAKLRQKGVEALFLNPQSENGMILMYQQLLDAKWNIPIYAAYYPGFSTFLGKYGKKADGIVFADLPFVASSLDDKGKELYELYKKENGTPKSSEFYFITALAALKALHAATMSGTDEHAYLYSHTFEGLFGRFGFDANGEVRGDRLTFILKTIRDGKVIGL